MVPCCPQNDPNRPRRKQDSRWSYLVCACATFSQTLTMGVPLCFGVLLPVIMEEFNSNRQKTAWIASMTGSLVFFASPVAGRMTEKFSCRCVTMFGAITCAIGILLASFANSVTFYYFTYSLFLGFGASCVRTSNFLVVAKYFHKRRPFATGIITSGAGLGLFVLPPIVQTLLDKFGLDHTLRFLAAFVLVGGIPSLVYDPNVEKDDQCDSTSQMEETESHVRQKAKLVDCSVWTVPSFVAFTLAFVLERFGTSITRTHLVKYSGEQGIPFDKSSRLLMFIGLSSTIARLLAGRLCNLECVNPHFVYQLGIFTEALSVIFLPLARGSYIHFVICSLFFGLGNGTGMATSNLIFLTCVDEERRASAFGLANCFASFSLLGGAPFAGFLADHLESYAPSFYLAGSTLLLCAALPFVLLCVKVNTNNESDHQESMIAVENERQIQYLSSC